MKRFVNDPRDAVDEMVEGFLAVHGAELRLLEAARVVVPREARAAGVRVIGGGGSGHEPAVLGYVGPGLLDAVVVGDLFASPPATAVLEAIRAVDCGDGVLLLIGNYAGDVMNFEMASRWARAEGHAVETVLVTDDAAVGDPDDLRSRRGLAGGILAWKVAGACAASGDSLTEVRRAAERTVGRLRTIAVAHGPATLPGSDTPAFAVGPDEYQFGVGHGEPGIRTEPMAPVDDIVDGMLGPLLSDGFLREHGGTAVTLLNGLGGSPLMELHIAQRRLGRQLERAGITIHRSFVGNLYTAMQTAGFSITLLDADTEIAGWMDAPAQAPCFVVRAQGDAP